MRPAAHRLNEPSPIHHSAAIGRARIDVTACDPIGHLWSTVVVRSTPLGSVANARQPARFAVPLPYGQLWTISDSRINACFGGERGIRNCLLSR
jgi:hypothetical protein